MTELLPEQSEVRGYKYAGIGSVALTHLLNRGLEAIRELVERGDDAISEVDYE